MKLIFLVFAFLLFLSANARDLNAKNENLKNTSSENKRDSIIPAGPNELYFNIGPSLSLLQGAFPTNELNMTFMYKRAIKNSRLAFRMGIAYRAEVQRSDQFSESSVSSPNSAALYSDITDSTRTKKFIVENPSKKIQLNLGMERRSKGNRRWKGFTGLDLVFGFYKHDAILQREKQVADMYGNWYKERSDTSTAMLDYKKATSFYFGISPKIGLSYAFNPHWVVSAQAAVLATFDTGGFFAWNTGTDKLYQLKSNTFNFGFNGIIDELNLVYRF